MARLCELLLARGLGGFADFYGMPGELGGSLFMNARCYEAEMSELVSEIRYLDATGGLAILGKEEGDWGYKRSPFQAGGRASGGLILGASFELAPADRPSLASRMAERRRDREAKGHYRLPSAGSVFKNDRAFGRPTGKILDELGLRGKRIGDALVSPWHANIFVNAGRARASDMRRLIDLARDEARRGFGFELEPEVVFVGDF
jgi:UDP-N-acetylmuramate dehydrogenase